MWVPTLKETNQPKYILLVEAIAEAIEKGELKVGGVYRRRDSWPGS